MRKPLKYTFFVIIILTLASCSKEITDFQNTETEATIYPDYAHIAIPFNMGPLNFTVQEQGKAFKSHFRAGNKSFWLRARGNRMVIPQGKWERLVSNNKEDTLFIDLFRKDEQNEWHKYPTIANWISRDLIDEFIVYRKIPPANVLWNEMGIYQHSLKTLKTYPISINQLTDHNCMNCHSISASSPDRFMFHMRAKYGGTMIKYGETLKFIDTSSDYIGSAGAYPSWHPSGKFIAFSVNRINQDFHSVKDKIAYVQDKYSDIVLYDVGNNLITRPQELATGARENLPTWSPDGKQLYFISAPKSTDSTNYRDLRYSLLRIGFDPATKSFGKIDTILDAGTLKKSISFPRIAPDNNTICFCLLDYGYFSIYNPESDIYTYRLDSKKLEKTEANSSDVESYPSWSQNGRWMMFVSKREDGILSKVYFCHMDEQGKTSKPFVAPQRDPDFYSRYLLNFNRPEFSSARIDLNPRKVWRAAREIPLKTVFDEANSVTITTGATSLSMEQPEEIYKSDR